MPGIILLVLAGPTIVKKFAEIVTYEDLSGERIPEYILVDRPEPIGLSGEGIVAVIPSVEMTESDDELERIARVIAFREGVRDVQLFNSRDAVADYWGGPGPPPSPDWIPESPKRGLFGSYVKRLFSDAWYPHDPEFEARRDAALRARLFENESGR